MKKILVTGCNGQLGRAINKEYAGESVEIINTDVAAGDHIVACDITSIDEVMKLAREKKPDVIINCAAHTNVDKCEEQWELAYKINAIGPRNLSIAATEVGAKLVHVSTDYVFAGMEPVPMWNMTHRHRSVLTEEANTKVKNSYSSLQTAILLCVPHGFTGTERTL